MKLIEKIRIGLPLKKTIVDKINEIISYLKATRLVQGPGIRIRETSNGVIVSAVSASRSPDDEDETPTPGAATYNGAFAVELVGGTSARIYHAADPSGEYAGRIRIGTTNKNMPVGSVSITSGTPTAIYLTVWYDTTATPPALAYQFTTSLSTAVQGEQGWYKELAHITAAGSLIQDHLSGDIEITGRWI